ncbi:O-antigen ligase family protein [Noviherbaspirillum galbum]|uniref:O-antigen ligase family protein n=1 Tax=Noviherbaspirillum galbum TaxID=2709383 RepID=A0A6B3SST9_9BURK|nr:O-antigen ligase [Noviherbaspirillum galbum]NEX60679.1 O-antigen ligase family protein [Noviherbaspirillum galbum]
MTSPASGSPPSERAVLVFSTVLFLIPALALTTRVGITLAELAVLAGSLWYGKRLWRERHALFGPARGMMLAIVAHVVLAILSLILSGMDPRFLENPLRALLMLPLVGLVAIGRPKSDWFWYGLFVGTIGAALLAAYQRFGLHVDRAEGFHMAITFGDTAMAMALMSLAGVARFAGTRLALLPLLAFVAGVVASILSGTRGGWMALVLSFIPLVSHGRHAIGRRVIAFGLAGIFLLAGASLFPELGVRKRFEAIATDMTEYRSGNSNTSIGLRFENWKGGVMIFKEHPLTGIGRANYERGINELVARGVLPPETAGLRHAHNELLNAFATQGIIGGLSMIFLYAAPFAFFTRRLRHDPDCRPVALAGLLLVLSYIDFGLTQVLFVHHIGSAFYIIMTSVLAGLCINSGRLR